jgi:hypothetical protein
MMTHMKQDFDDILNECLERVAAGEDITACIERYPEQAEELASLLRIAKVTMKVASEVSQTDDVKARILARVQQRIAQADAGVRPLARERKGIQRFVPSFAANPVFRPVMIGFAAVFVLLVAAGGSTLASADSVTGEPLYWLKKTSETVALQIPRSDEGRAKAQAHLAVVRGQEVQVLLSRGRLFDAERAGLRIRYHLNVSADHIGILLSSDPVKMTPRPAQLMSVPTAVGLRQVLERDESTVKKYLTSLLDEAPSTHQFRIRRIIYHTDYGYRVLIQAIDERNSFAVGQPVSGSSLTGSAY